MLNKITLIGNLGRDPEMTYTPQGTPITKFSLAVTRRWTGKDGQKQDETTWFDVVAFNRVAETANTYLRKGSKCYVEGRMTSRKYTGKDGAERTAWNVNLDELVLLDPKGASTSTSTSSGTDDVSPDDIPF